MKKNKFILIITLLIFIFANFILPYSRVIILKLSILTIAYAIWTHLIILLIKKSKYCSLGWIFLAALILTIIFVSNQFLHVDPRHSAGVKSILMWEQVVIMSIFWMKNDEKRKKII
jgi:hypothetical protein